MDHQTQLELVVEVVAVLLVLLALVLMVVERDLVMEVELVLLELL
jgi:hypothetical protein